MSEYIKIDASFYDRLLFLFVSLINKEYIISNSIQDKTIRTTKKMSDVDTEYISHDNDDIPDKINIPFFNLDNTTVESNLK